MKTIDEIKDFNDQFYLSSVFERSFYGIYTNAQRPGEIAKIEQSEINLISQFNELVLSQYDLGNTSEINYKSKDGTDIQGWYITPPNFDKKKINLNEVLKLTNLNENDNFSELVDICLAKNEKKLINIINENKIDIFDKFINSMYIRNSKTYKNIFLSKISLSAINNRFLADISKTGPFGSSNPYPIFLLENVRIINPKILKKKYIYFYLVIIFKY